MITGFVVMGIGVYWLGIANTYGVENGFKNHGIYKFTRNPQYIGDIALLFGIMIFVNSFELLIIFTIYILTFIAMIFSEESWLEERYGKEYIVYKSKTPRFIMKFSNNK
jgi:protein-S-isoprenylcysteine O-methyltransferase Ste14